MALCHSRPNGLRHPIQSIFSNIAKAVLLTLKSDQVMSSAQNLPGTSHLSWTKSQKLCKAHKTPPSLPLPGPRPQHFTCLTSAASSPPKLSPKHNPSSGLFLLFPLRWLNSLPRHLRDSPSHLLQGFIQASRSQ